MNEGETGTDWIADFFEDPREIKEFLHKCLYFFFVAFLFGWLIILIGKIFNKYLPDMDSD